MTFKISYSRTDLYRGVQKQHYFVALRLTCCTKGLSNRISPQVYILLQMPVLVLFLNVILIKHLINHSICYTIFFPTRDRRFLLVPSQVPHGPKCVRSPQDETTFPTFHCTLSWLKGACLPFDQQHHDRTHPVVFFKLIFLSQGWSFFPPRCYQCSWC